MLLISEGILSGEGRTRCTPCRCADTEAMCACMRDTVAAECAHKCAQAPLAQSKFIAASLDLIEKHYRAPRFNLTALAAELCVTPQLSVHSLQGGDGRRVHEISAGPYRLRAVSGCWPTPVQKIEMVGFQDESIFPASFLNWREKYFSS